MKTYSCLLSLAACAHLLALGYPALSHGQILSPVAPTDAVVRQAVLERLHVAQFTLQDIEPSGTTEELEVGLLLGGQPHRVALQKHSIRAPGFRVVAQDRNGAFCDVAVPEPQTYRGYVVGYGSSSVWASIAGGRIRAVVCLGDSNDSAWVIEPLQNVSAEGAPRQHVVYRSEDLSPQYGICGNQDGPAAKPSRALPKDSGTASLAMKVCRVACDADYEYYTTNGSSVATTTADIETIINGVSAIFERDTQISFQITQIIVRSAEPDPYDAPTVDGVLSQFRLDWQNNHQDIPRDIAHLFTGKAFGTIVGNSYTDQVCPGMNHYSLVRSRWQTDLGLRIAVSAHEIGHSFDAVHCDYDSDPRCRIMCSSMGGCSAGVHSFEDANISRIRAFAASASCLTGGTVATPTTSLPFSDNFDSIIYPPQVPNSAKWTGADLALCQYKHLEISIGRDFNYRQKLGTVRTLPMQLRGTAQVSYKVNPESIPSSQSLKIEYFDSTAYVWRNLRTITSDASTSYTSYADTVPANGAGDYFAVRFSAWGTAYTAANAWMVDDVSIVAIPSAPRLAVARTPTNTLVISWPSSTAGFTLQTNTSLTPASWGAMSTSPYEDGINKFIIVNPPADNRFFRLAN